MMGWYNGWTGGGFDWFWMLVMMFGLASLLGIGTWTLVRLTNTDEDRRGGAIETPRQILDRRLAAGEIDADEYLRARQVLEDRAATKTAAGASS